MYRSSPPPAASSDSEISELDSLVRELRSLQIQEAAKLGFGPDNRSSRYQEPPRYTNSYDDDNQDDQDLFGDLAVLQGHAPHPSQKAQSSGVSPVNRLFQPDTVQLLHLSPQNPTEQRIRRAFINQWNATPKPYVSHVFLVLHNSPSAQAHVNDFDAYRDQVENQVRPTPATTSAFHGTRRACWIGLSPSRTNPCNDPTCSVCRILEGSFMVSKSKGGLYGYGIYNSTDSHKSDNYQNNKDGGFRAQFLTTVVTGRKNYMPRQAPAGASLPGNGYHSVEGHATGPNETVVYRDDAMLAHALIMYSTDRQIQTYRTPVTLSHHSVYFITNLLVPKALDLNLSNHRVSGYRPHGKDNQQWVLEKEGGGWAIRNKQRADLYLGLESQNYLVNGSRAAGVGYDQRVIWEIQSAEDNTFRLAILHNNSHNLDLDKRDINKPGSVPDGAAITLWNHVANAGQQRWVFDYIETWKGANSVTPGGGQQVQVPQNNAIYTLTNNRYRTRLDYSIPTSRVVGFQSRASDNQKWIFQQEGSGWVIRSKHDPNQYLAVQYGSFGDGTNIVVGPYDNRVTWQVKAAMNNCVRINPVGHWGSEIDLSTRWGASPGAAVVLYHHIVNQTNQRWELVSTGEWYSGGNSGYQPGQNNGSFQRGPGSQTQKPVNNGVYTLRNERYSSVIDYSQGHGTIVGYSSNLKDNQLWIFQREGSGWVLKNRAEQGKYLGLQYGSYLNGTHLAPVDYSNRVVWEVKDAESNTVRINASGYWSSEIDLSTRGGSNPGTPVILYHHINNAANQRWRLMFHGTQF